MCVTVSLDGEEMGVNMLTVPILWQKIKVSGNYPIVTGWLPETLFQVIQKLPLAGTFWITYHPWSLVIQKLSASYPKVSTNFNI